MLSLAPPTNILLNNTNDYSQMKQLIFTFSLVFYSILAFAQTPFKAQFAIPVYFNDIAKKVANVEKQTSTAQLSGIALMFLDTVNATDELIVTSSSELVIWRDYIGKSTKLSFMIPDSQMIGRLELMYFDSKCSVAIWREDRTTGEVVHAAGDLLAGPAGYSMILPVDQKSKNKLAEVFDRLNILLMKLHTRELREVPIKPWFSLDSLNLIVGADSQFGTDYELFWFDQNLHNRLKTLAINDFSELILFDKKGDHLQDSIIGRHKIVHNASVVKSEDLPGIRGTVSITLKPDDSARYIFFKPRHKYKLFVDYSFFRGDSGPGDLSINRFGLKDLATDDFVELDMLDFVTSGFPVMYVDLIQGVVTADGGSWDISNVIHAIEDVFGATRLPYE